MARILKQEIKQQILDDNQLAADFCNQIGVKVISLDQMFRKDNRTLTHTDNILWLSARLNKSIDELLTEAETKEPATV